MSATPSWPGKALLPCLLACTSPPSAPAVGTAAPEATPSHAPADTDLVLPVDADTATPRHDAHVVWAVTGEGRLDGPSYRGTETWTWRGLMTDRIYCVLQYRLDDLAHAPVEAQHGPIQRPCIACDFYMTAVAHDRVDLTPGGACDARDLPRYEAFTATYRVGYGHGDGRFWEHDAARDLWFPNASTADRFDESTGTWHYEFRSTLVWRQP